MKSWSVPTVPAGKKPKLKNQKGFLQLVICNIKNIISLIKKKGIRASSFIAASSFILIAALVLHGYFSNYVYIVIFDGREIGAVRDVKQVENLIDELTGRFYDYYGMVVAPENRIRLVKDYRPETIPDPRSVEETIRQEITFLTDAYLLMIDDKPLVPVASKKVLEDVLEYFENAYLNESRMNRIIDVSVVEDLSLRTCEAAPRDLFGSEEVIALLVNNETDRNIATDIWSQANTFSFAGHHQPSVYVTPGSNIPNFPGGSQGYGLDYELISAGVNVKTVEELVVTEIVHHDLEIEYDEEMWVVQTRVATPGQDGRKETVYHLTRINGNEVDRVAVSERMIREPVTQLEIQGTAQVPSRGTGQFIWPVEGGGEVTPGRGFSSWHTGIDIDAKPGTNILAADSGVVWYSGFGGSQGNYIIVYHGNYWTLYLHNQVNLVKKGATVKQGDVIARVGSTGRSTGPHLHFEVRRDDGSGEWRAYYQHKPVDPLRFFRP